MMFCSADYDSECERIVNVSETVVCCCGFCIASIVIAKANAGEYLVELNSFAFPPRQRKPNKMPRLSFCNGFRWYGNL